MRGLFAERAAHVEQVRLTALHGRAIGDYWRRDDHAHHHPPARRLAPARPRRRNAQGRAAVHRQGFRPRHSDAELDAAGAHHARRDRLSRAGQGGTAAGVAPLGRAVQRHGAIIAMPVLAGLNHRYARI